jgi:hypothetical protein
MSPTTDRFYLTEIKYWVIYHSKLGIFQETRWNPKDQYTEQNQYCEIYKWSVWWTKPVLWNLQKLSMMNKTSTVKFTKDQYNEQNQYCEIYKGSSIMNKTSTVKYTKDQYNEQNQYCEIYKGSVKWTKPVLWNLQRISIMNKTSREIYKGSE